jgi:hypothetical protein
VSRSPDRLYELLPAVHRLRDAAIGEPLRALLGVITEQVDVVEDDIARLYDNWFIETCEDWVVPYIGDLIGFRPVHDAGEAGAVDSLEGRLRNEILIPRSELANTLGFRRRKGTLALLESLAPAVAGWPARAVEFYRLLAWAQHVDYRHLARGRTLDLRDGHALDLLDGPFDCAAHTVDVRRVASRHEPGRYNIPSVGVFVWRLKSYSVTHTRAARYDEEGPHAFHFSALGNDAPLFTKPEPEKHPPHADEEVNVPVPIRRRALEERVAPSTGEQTNTLRDTQASAIYYGEGRSVAIYAPDWPSPGAPQPIPRANVVPANLTDWRYRAGRDEVALDPVLGRIVFPAGHAPQRVWVDYHYGFSADMGGGEYDRSLSQPVLYTRYRVCKYPPEPGAFPTINAALAAWRNEQQALGPEPGEEPARDKWHVAKEKLRAAVIEIEDSAVYREALAIALETGESLQIRAGNRRRPVIHLTEQADDTPGAFVLSGKRGSRFKLDGIVVVGHSIVINGPDRRDEKRFPQGDLCDVTIRHSTLVPGWWLECNCEPKRPHEASLKIFNSNAVVKIEHSIVGSISVVADEVTTDPVEIFLTDSILDATGVDRNAIGAPDLPSAFARVSVVRSTVLGEVATHAIALAENSIFTGLVRVARRQQGCMRFCWVAVTPETRTPRRYHCQPDLAVAAVDEIEAAPPLTADEKAKQKDFARHRVRPRFNSVRYGMPTYCQLALDCTEEIARGADDESEMGAFHDLFQPQRTANLRARLDEYTPAGMEAGIVFAT